jgi:LPS export ABC transporter protein LptC
LFLLAVILIYSFYYRGNNNIKSVKKTPNKDITNIEKDESSNFFEDVEYKGIDANGNRYLLQSKLATFNEQNPELIDMIGMHATFYFKDGKILNIYGDEGKYNNKTNDMEFRENVRVVQDLNKIFAENLDYFNVKKIINIYGNVRGIGLDGNFTTDILELDIENQTVDFSMKSNEKVNVNLKR